MEIKDKQQAKKVLEAAQQTQEQVNALVEYIKKRIEESGYKKGYLAQQLGLSLPAFSLRLKNNNLTIEQLKTLIQILDK
jgi:hypothetical protein